MHTPHKEEQLSIENKLNEFVRKCYDAWNTDGLLECTGFDFLDDKHTIFQKLYTLISHSLHLVWNII